MYYALICQRLILIYWTMEQTNVNPALNAAPLHEYSEQTLLLAYAPVYRHRAGGGTGNNLSIRKLNWTFCLGIWPLSHLADLEKVGMRTRTCTHTQTHTQASTQTAWKWPAFQNKLHSALVFFLPFFRRLLCSDGDSHPNHGEMFEEPISPDGQGH